MDLAPFDSLISAVHQDYFLVLSARISFWASFKNAGQLHEKHSRGRITLASKKSRQRELRLQTILLHNPHKGAEIDGLMDDSIRFNIVLKPAASYDHNGNRLHPSVTLLPR
jgi:hypothetical protein